MIQLTLWATSSASNLYSTSEYSQVLELAHPHYKTASTLSGVVLTWASSTLPDIVQTQFGHYPGPGTMPSTQSGSSHLVLKCKGMIEGT